MTSERSSYLVHGLSCDSLPYTNTLGNYLQVKCYRSTHNTPVYL